MIVKSIKCQNFRNFEKIEFFPSSNMNIIFGDNAQGKTNLLEAIWLFCGAKSFRGAKDKEMVGFEKNSALLECEFNFGECEKFAKIKIENKRQAEIGGKSLSSAAGLAGKFYSIVFSPLDLNLINNGPNVRRRFLDTAIGQIYPQYNEKLRTYIKAVNQRNSILRDMKNHIELESILEDFENSLARLIMEVSKYRVRYVEILSEIAPEIYDGISDGKEKLEIFYQSKIEDLKDIEKIKKALKDSRKEDIFTGNTSVGPHRDDLELTLNKISLKNFGSQGQKRSVCLALKLAEAKVLKKISGEYPIALLDDVMSELDKARQDYVLNHIKDWQVFITCCDPSNISGLKSGKIINISGGKIISEREV